MQFTVSERDGLKTQVVVWNGPQDNNALEELEAALDTMLCDTQHPERIVEIRLSIIRHVDVA